MSTIAELPIADIDVGKRHRRDMGDIDALAGNIADIGLLHPIVVTPTGRLIAGARRLRAFHKLGRNTIPATIVDLDQVVRGEYAENFFRKTFTPSEMADIADALEPIERAKAKERQFNGLKHGARMAEFAARDTVGRALDHVGKMVGAHRDTITKARAVRDAAKAEPERFGKLAEDMDRTGRVNGPFKRLNVIRQAAAIRAEPPPYPSSGPYRVIVADPPWPYEAHKADPSHRATHPYPQMSLAEICAKGVQVRAIAHPDCILWLWVTNHHMREGFAVLDAWGFEHKTVLTWVKDRFGYGDWLRGQTEHCLMAVRGKPTVHLINQSTRLHGPVRANSQKPDEFYKLIEGLCPASRYAELFARTKRDRWDAHGDEVRPVDAGGTP
jgi:N6-adenosine-specific RNA methylase IME4